MRLFLGPGVHAACVGEDVVFLDTICDAYFCLAGAADFLSLGAGGQVDVVAEEIAVQMLEAGLLSQEREPGVKLTAPRPAASIRLAQPAFRPMTPGLVVGAITATFKVARGFSGRSFARLLEGPSPGAAAFENPSPAMSDAVAQFETLRPWLPLQGECLLRSYHLRVFLRARGLDALWVFGVRTWPFDAHCWLQSGQTVLDEDLERLSAYQPIMVA